MDDAIEQFDRVKRWLKKFELVFQSGTPTSKTDIDNIDIIYAFFQNCFHLKDWLINSNILKSEVDAFVESHKDLQICRDICNGSKHLIVDRPSIDPKISKTLHSSVYSVSMAGMERTELIYWITVNNTPVDAYKLAQGCVIWWEAFLKEKKILKS